MVKTWIQEQFENLFSRTIQELCKNVYSLRIQVQFKN